MIRIRKIWLDGLLYPQGVEEMPRLTWVLESDGRNVRQRAYQVQAAMDASFGVPLADTGKIESGESAHVPLSVPALLPCKA